MFTGLHVYRRTLIRRGYISTKCGWFFEEIGKFFFRIVKVLIFIEKQLSRAANAYINLLITTAKTTIK